jgi:NAD(P)-dependent dehydrogenase (short-subunit alcohol dehydrogenase family)
MREQGGGTIVNIAGRAFGLKDRAAYVASKLGLIGLTREAARELAEYNIRVNAVCPGVIESEAPGQNEEILTRWEADIPMSRLGQPRDVVGLVMFLCSDEARYITGQAINVDGGQVMS